jgi:hypothetical protein
VFVGVQGSEYASEMASFGRPDGAGGWIIEWPRVPSLTSPTVAFGTSTHAGYEMSGMPDHQAAVELLFASPLDPLVLETMPGCREAVSVLDYQQVILGADAPDGRAIQVSNLRNPASSVAVKLVQHSRDSSYADVSYLSTPQDLVLSDLLRTSSVVTNTVPFVTGEPMPADQELEVVVRTQEGDEWVVVVAEWSAEPGALPYMVSFHAAPLALIPEAATPGP